MKARVELSINNSISHYCETSITEYMGLENIKREALKEDCNKALEDLFNRYIFGNIKVEDTDIEDFANLRNDLIDIICKFTKIISVHIEYEIPTNEQKAES